MNKSEKINIIIQSFLIKIISDEWTEMNENELFHICQYVDFNKIPDRTIADNEILHKMIQWETVDRMKIVRLISRNIKLMDYIDLSKYNYTIREAREMLKIFPFIIDKLNIDLNNISNEDAYILLTIGNEYLFRKVEIKNFIFTSKQIYKIISSNQFNGNIIREVNLKALKDYHICDIIINTGDSFLDILDLEKITARKWIEILKIRPELISYCNFKEFTQSDIFNSIELICLFPYENFDFLVKNRDYKNDVSAFGWEKLIICKPDEYIDICCYWKLNETNWKNILNNHPRLSAYNKL